MEVSVRTLEGGGGGEAGDAKARERVCDEEQNPSVRGHEDADRGGVGCLRIHIDSGGSAGGEWLMYCLEAKMDSC